MNKDYPDFSNRFDKKFIHLFIEGCDIVGVHPMILCNELIKRELEGDASYLYALKKALETEANYDDENDDYEYVNSSIVLGEKPTELLNHLDEWSAQEIIEKIIIDTDDTGIVSEIRELRKQYTLDDRETVENRVKEVVSAIDKRATDFLSILISESNADEIHEQITQFVSLIDSLNAGDIILNEKAYNLVKDQDYLIWCHSQDDPADSDEYSILADLEHISERYSMPRLYCNYLLWKIWGNPKAFDSITTEICNAFYGDVFPHLYDSSVRKEYALYIEHGVDMDIVMVIAFISHFTKYYSDLIKLYVSAEKIMTLPSLPYIDANAYYMGEDYITLGQAQIEIDQLGGFEKFLEKHNGLNNEEDTTVFDIDYGEIVNSLTDEEKYETGIYAYYALVNTIDIMYILKYVLLELEKELADYRALRYELSESIDKLIYIIYKYREEHEENAFGASISMVSDRIKENTLVTLAAKLMIYAHDRNIESLMQCKKDLWNRIAIVSQYNQDILEETIEKITVQIKNEVGNDDQFDQIKQDLTHRYTMLDSSIISTLSTAEYLYNTYISNTKEIEGFDYSFISILYYQALEEMLNDCFYAPYTKTVKQDKLTEYFIKPQYFSVNGNGLKPTIELGTMGFFLKNIEKTKLGKFVEDQYPGINVKNIKKIGNKLIDPVSKRRNQAAHIQTLNRAEASKDKEIVYIKSGNYSDQIIVRDMINQILNILYKSTTD